MINFNLAALAQSVQNSLLEGDDEGALNYWGWKLILKIFPLHDSQSY